MLAVRASNVDVTTALEEDVIEQPGAAYLDDVTVLYTSGLTAYSSLYLVEVGEFDELPDLKQAKAARPFSILSNGGPLAAL